MRHAAAIAVAVIALGVSGVGAYQFAQAPVRDAAHWRPIAWPFPRDGWPAGRAFRCDGACEGTDLYLRAKLGFCNCDRGVADDDEVDRVADLDLISPRFAALAPGETVAVGELSGRARSYDLDMPGTARRAAVGIALSRRCDLFVAVAKGAAAPADMQAAALAFLKTGEMERWMLAALDGR
jgi:hypothetical protein